MSPVGRVMITLVRGQEVRWDIAVQAKRSGLNLMRVSLFKEDAFEGYVCKR
jgi:hypothetical protein